MTVSNRLFHDYRSGFNCEQAPYCRYRQAARTNTEFADKSAPTGNGAYLTELRQAKWERFQPRIAPPLRIKTNGRSNTGFTHRSQHTGNGGYLTQLRQAKWERFQPRTAPLTAHRDKWSHQHPSSRINPLPQFPIHTSQCTNRAVPLLPGEEIVIFIGEVRTEGVAVQGKIL